MTYQATFQKRPQDVIDFPVDFSVFLVEHADAIQSFTYDCDTGLSIGSAARVGSQIMLFCVGGRAGRQYRAYAEITTTGARVKREDIRVRVRGTGIVIGDIDGGDPWGNPDVGTDYDGGLP